MGKVRDQNVKVKTDSIKKNAELKEKLEKAF